MDQFYGYIDKFTPCKKSCSACCYYQVTISEVEVLHIENCYNISRKKVPIPKINIQGTPCCFLNNDLCSVYKARPFVCRRHIILAADNRWCAHDCEHKFPMLSFVKIDTSYDVIVQQLKSQKLYDIREVF